MLSDTCDAGSEIKRVRGVIASELADFFRVNVAPVAIVPHFGCYKSVFVYFKWPH